MLTKKIKKASRVWTESQVQWTYDVHPWWWKRLRIYVSCSCIHQTMVSNVSTKGTVSKKKIRLPTWQLSCVATLPTVQYPVLPSRWSTATAQNAAQVWRRALHARGHSHFPLVNAPRFRAALRTMAPKQGKSAQNSAAASSQAASKNAKGAKKKKWSKGKVSCSIWQIDMFVPANQRLWRFPCTWNVYCFFLFFDWQSLSGNILFSMMSPTG